MNPLNGAVDAASRGLHVFPLRSARDSIDAQKRPAFSGWQDWATTDEDKIRQWATANPGCNWGVYLDKSGHCAVDLDGATGIEAWQQLQTGHGQAPVSLHSRTWSGGLHLIYTGSIANSQSKLADKIDTRGTGGYIVCWGSIIYDPEDPRTILGRYELEADRPPQPVPAWISDKLTPRAEPVETPVVEVLDKPHHQAAALEYLQQHASIVEGRGADQQLYATFAQLRDLGCTMATADKMAQQYLNPRCQPPWDLANEAHRDHWYSKLRNAYQYAQHSQPGAKTPEAIAAAEFGITPGAVAPAYADRTIHRVSDLNLDAIPRREWVMQDRYIKGFLSVVIAPGGTGKSTLQLLDAMSIVTGKPLSGYEVKQQGPVWLYNLEDPLHEMQRRIAAMALHHCIHPSELRDLHYCSGRDHPLVLVREAGGQYVINEDAIGWITDTIKREGIVAFMPDPYIRLHECKENDNNAQDKVAFALQRIADAGCSTGASHHTRKKPNGQQQQTADVDDARGAKALTDAARLAHVISPMNEQEAERMGVDNRRQFLRLDSVKANMSPPLANAMWYQLAGQTLPNTETVGVLDLATLRDQTEEREAQSEETEARLLAQHLRDTMEPGTECTLPALVDQIASTHSLMGILDSVTQDRRRKQKVMRLISMIQGVEIQNRPEGARNRYWVVVVDNVSDELMCRHVPDVDGTWGEDLVSMLE
jgi:hypothetical protein